MIAKAMTIAMNVSQLWNMIPRASIINELNKTWSEPVAKLYHAITLEVPQLL